MTTPRPLAPVTPLRARGPADAPRRRQVEARLAVLGASTDRARLARALEDLGPVFNGFGRHLAGRPERLTEADRVALSRLSGRRPPLAPEEAVGRVEADLGAAVDRLFDRFEALPVTADGHSQSHRAWLDGVPLRVRLADPREASELDRDAALLPLLEPFLAVEDDPVPWDLDTAAEDYRSAVLRARDPHLQAERLEALGRDPQGLGPTLRWPAVVRERTAGDVLTVTELPGSPWDHRLRGTDPALAAGHDAEDLAIRLSRAWLRTAHFGAACPVAFTTADLVVTPDGAPAWQGGTLGRLDEPSRPRLWSYLQAVAARDPDAAFLELIGELELPPETPAAERDARGLLLRQRLRQAVPLRDGGWGARDDLAGELFTHARITAELGYRPSPSLTDWWGGLTHLCAVTRPLAWRRDPLQESVDGARLSRHLAELTDRADPAEVRAALGGALHTMVTLPKKLDQVLSVAADGRASLRLEMVEPPETRRRKDATAATLAWVVTVGALVLLAHRLAPLLPAPWGERVAAGALLLGGLALLPRLLR